MKRAVVHVIGAGVSGLSTAMGLLASGACEVVVHEAMPYAGGRRRSFYDDALALTVDSGNFPLLSCNAATLALIDAIGARGEWRAARQSGAAFVDMADAQRWALRPNEGRLPWWLLDARRRAPRTVLADYWRARGLLRASPHAAVVDFSGASGPAFERLWRPLTLAALNADPSRASARLASSALREVLRAGGRGARVLLPVNGVGRAFVEPLLKRLRRDGASVRFDRRLRALDHTGDRVLGLEFEHDRIDLGPRDAVILATPPTVAAALAPSLEAPREFNAAVAVHFACPPPKSAPEILGVVNGVFHWLFAYADHLSVTIKDAGARVDEPRESLASACWRDVAALTGLSDAKPAWRVVPSRRASFACSPEENARRPPCETAWRNLFLAGAYVQNGLPDSIEGAVRSGGEAARRVSAAIGAL